MTEVSPGTGSARAGLAGRVLNAVSWYMRELEQRMQDGSATIAEDAKLLGGLTRTLETLTSLDRKTADEAPAIAPDVAALRSELTARLAALLPANALAAASKASLAPTDDKT